MQKVKIYGASDDLVEIEGVKGSDEFNVYNAKFNLGGKMCIHALGGASQGCGLPLGGG